MEKWLRFIALITLAGIGLVLGVRPETGFSHAWLALALIAIFAASESRYWDNSRG